MKKNIIEKVEKYVKETSYGESTGHDWWHIKRVYNLSLKINEVEKKNAFVIQMIALLHDIFDDKFSSGDTRKNLINLMNKLEIYNLINNTDRENILYSI